MSELSQSDAYFLSLLQYDDQEKVAGMGGQLNKLKRLQKTVDKLTDGTKSERAKFMKTDTGFFGSLTGPGKKAKKVATGLEERQSKMRKLMRKERKAGGTNSAEDIAAYKDLKKASKRARRIVSDARKRQMMNIGGLAAGGVGLGAAGTGAYHLATND